MSEYLSPQSINALTLTVSPRSVIVQNNVPLEATHLILLALNEECRKLRRGCFYSLPSRQDLLKGHPCDLVFVDEVWGQKSLDTWDLYNWQERQHLCNAGEFTHAGWSQIHFTDASFQNKSSSLKSKSSQSAVRS